MKTLVQPALVDAHTYIPVIQWLYKAPLCITLTIKTWVVAYFFNFSWEKKFKKKIIKELLCIFLVRTLQYLKNKKNKKFCPQKVQKTTLKSCSEKLKSTFFSLLPDLPKRPK
jgi:hypothetical protein